MTTKGAKEEKQKGITLDKTEQHLGNLGFASILENIDEGVIIADKTGHIRYINERASLYLGNANTDIEVDKRSEVLGLYDPDSLRLIDPEELPLKKAIKGIETYNKIILVQNEMLSSGAFMKVNGKPIYDADGELSGGMISFYDITEQIQNKQEEKKKKDFYFSILNRMSEGLAQFDKEGRIQTVNASLQRKLGVTEEELIGSKAKDLAIFEDDDRTKLAQKEEDRKAGKADTYIQKTRAKDGSYIYFSVIAQPILDEEGNVSGSIAILSDITDQVKAEERVKESEQNYRNLVERMNEGVLYTNVHGEVQFINKSFTQLTGLTKDQLKGKPLHELLDVRNISQEELQQKLQRRLQGEPEVYDVLFTGQDGKDYWLRISASPVFDENDEVMGVMGLFTDVTKEKEVAIENKRLRKLVASTPDYIGIGDRVGRPIFLNEASRQKLRLGPDEDISKINIYDRVAYQDISVYTDEIVPALKEKGSWEGEVTLVDADGKWIRVSQVVLAEKDDNGRIQYVYVVARDISETRNLARIAELNPGPILRVSPQGKIEYANPASELLLEKWHTQQEGQLPEIWQKVVSRSLEEGNVREYEVECDNTIYDLKVVPILDQWLVNIIGTDVTKRKHAEKLLKESEEKYRAVVEDQTEMICRFLQDGVITFANEAYCRYFNLKREDIIGTNVLDEFNEEEYEHFVEHINQLTPENPVSSYERKYQDENGETHWQLWMNRAIFNSIGDFTEYQSVGRDITALKQAQHAVSRQKTFLRDVIDANPNIIYVTDTEGTITLVNKAFEKEYEVERDELDNQNINDILSKRWQYINTQEKISQNEYPIVSQEEPLIDTKTGDKRWFFTTKSPILSELEEDSQQVLTIAIDITERKEAEEALRNQLKLEEMISQISLDFINVDLDNIDHSIHQALQSICQETGLDFAFIGSIENETFRILKWYKEGDHNPFSAFKNEGVNASHFQWLSRKVEERGLIHIPSVEDMEGEAQVEKRYLSKLGIESLVTIPLYIKNQFTGYLTFASTYKQHYWSAENLTLFSIMGQVFSNALERKNTETQLNYKVKFENLVTQISTEFITISIDEIDNAIEVGLEKVADMLGVEAGLMFTYDRDSKTFSLSHRYHQSIENLDSSPYQNLPLDEYKFSNKKLKKGEYVAYSDIDQLPEEGANIRSVARQLDIQSFIMLPVRFQNQLIGSLVFGSTEKQTFWSAGSRPLLNIVSQIFANALTRKRTELSLLESQELYRTLASNIPHSTVLLFDDNLVYKVVEGASLGKIGIDNDHITGRTPEELFDKELVDKLKPLHRTALEDEENVIEHRFANDNHYYIHLLPVTSEQGETFAGMLIFLDVSELKNAQLELERQTEELKRSNSELEMFAYAASHDLREPLRMVNSYVKLIQKRLENSDDQDLHDFMNFAVDGVSRMQELINDLLEYSRVDRKGKSFTNVEGRQVVEVAKKNLEQMILESGATINVDDLPTIQVDQAQFVSLFQNLINNAIKFRKEEPLEVNISAKSKGDKWLFTVADNGMGIEKTHFERIFTIFQRLHSRKDYEGTGVGLAICNKIVERHGGEMWVSSEIGEGTTFHFTIDKSPTN